MNFSILIVEDEQEFLEQLKLLVELIVKRHYPMLELSIDTAMNGKKALALAQKNHYDLILSDIVMPKMDGVTFIKRLRSFNTQVPIIAITALTSEEDIKKIILAGANNYISKPLNRYIFTAVITNLIDSSIKKFSPFNKHAINLFTHSLLKYRKEFFIDQIDDLNFFIEHFSKEHPLLTGSQPFRALVEFTQKLLEYERSTSIVVEEDIEHLYLSVTHIKKFPEPLLYEIMERFDIPPYMFKTNGYTFSILLFKDPSRYPLSTRSDKEEKMLFFSEIKEVEHLLQEASKDQPPLMDASTYMQTRELLYKKEISEILLTLEKLDLALEGFCDLQNEEWPQSLDEIMKIFQKLRTLFSRFETFFLLDVVFKLFIDYMDNNERDLKVLRNRLLFCRVLHTLKEDLQEFAYNLFEKRLRNIFSYDIRFANSATTLAKSLLFKDDEDE